jgi:hypothetical protein
VKRKVILFRFERGTAMVESFVYGTWIGGQILYWFFLRHQTHVLGTLYWEALQLRFVEKFVEGK